jgi:septal ring factor EnvC (AmiA/AmiB activator)
VKKVFSLFLGCCFVAANVFAQAQPIHSNEKLTHIRKQVLDLEQDIIQGMHSAKLAKANMKKIQQLLKLQKEERALGEERSAQLSTTVNELETRKQVLDQKITEQRILIRKSLIAVERSIHTNTVQLPEQEILEAPRRKVLAALVQRGIAEVEALRIDLADADELESRIADEKQQLTYLFADLDEQKGILELNRQLQVDILKKHQQEHLDQLDNYRKLKVAESQVENLIQNFNSRVELEKTTESERQASQLARDATREVESASQSAFAKLKGVLKLPLLGGKILTAYGRAYDAKSGLYVFKKGIDIRADKKQTVRAIYSGQVAFAGELPDYGKVAIIDHGDHFYSLCAHLGSYSKKTGDLVAPGEAIGLTDDLGTPVYFEIRSRNVAVNPLQWISN